MEFFRIYRTIPFMQKVWRLNIISLLVFLISIFSIARNGFEYSIEFTGGTLIIVNCSENISLEGLKKSISKIGYKDFHIQGIGSSHKEFEIRLPLNTYISQENQIERILESLHQLNRNIKLKAFESIGPQVRSAMYYDGLLSIVLVVFGIFLYLAIRFSWKFSVAGILANFHDAVIILGFFSFFHWEFSLSVLAGILTALGYSINESVIIMDRIRENSRKKHQIFSLRELINCSITQTISRTTITHASTLVVVLSMFFFGGQALHYFSLALMIGIFFGIYSSIFVTAALIMWMNIRI